MPVARRRKICFFWFCFLDDCFLLFLFLALLKDLNLSVVFLFFGGGLLKQSLEFDHWEVLGVFLVCVLYVGF